MNLNRLEKKERIDSLKPFTHGTTLKDHLVYLSEKLARLEADGYYDIMIDSWYNGINDTITAKRLETDKEYNARIKVEKIFEQQKEEYAKKSAKDELKRLKELAKKYNKKLVNA